MIIYEKFDLTRTWMRDATQLFTEVSDARKGVSSGTPCISLSLHAAAPARSGA
jgi:hypothetical protein